ncbi:probable serine/threonine-protein kinase DDB_G0278901 isoform X2 [Microplitis mediator]|uniref:probable serine/threonine-protein kinase DDB_G0278901 isoform X2 n=1 Tax=Microplitis mediator TaxID=375433 RepID=UPI002557A42C|nr:probable serine/threonine-protein kinase DDB_G0278901 isoform X2 [Microplitis mediator]
MRAQHQGVSGRNSVDKSPKKEACSYDTVELLPCTICGRTFKPQSLEKHAKICERAAIKKRKPFDSFKQRLQGTELEEFLPKVITKGRDVRPEEKCGSRNTWKQTHDEFLRTIRAARGETVVTTSSQYRQVTTITPGAPTRSNEKGLCPTCSRQFGIKAYDRHVAWCKERILRVPTTQATNVAKERLDARMKYRAPLLKNRRMTNREKYAPRIKNNVTVNNNNINNNNNNNNINAVNSGLKIKDTSGPKSADPVNIKQPAVTERRSGQGKIDGVIAPGPVKSRPADRSIKHNPDLLILTPPDYPRSHNFQDSPTSIQKFKSSFPSLTSTEADDDFNKRKLKKKLKKKKSKCIVSGLSIGNPKVNDVTVNDDVTGMTVRPCHAHREELITWKQITCDSVQIKVYDSGLNDSSLINLPQQLDQTYLIKESAGDIDNDVTEGIDAILQRLDNDLKEDEDKLNKFESTPASPSKFNIDVTCASTPVSFKNDNYARENKMINEDGCERSARPKSESINRCSTYVIGETCDTNCLKIDTQNHNKFNNTDDNIILKDPLFDTNLPDVNDKKIIIDEIIPLNVRCKSNDTDYSLTPSRYFTSDSLDSARSNRIMRKKLRKKMNVLRDSTDSLISSVEAGNVRTTEPRLDARDKINGLDELKYSKNPKKSLMFPEIVNKPDGRLEKSFNDKEIPYWKRMMRTSRSRLFCHLMKNRNNFLPPVPFAQSPVQASRDRTRNGQISDEDLSSPDCFKKQECNKLSADSAYSSLNRKYSNGRNETTGRLDEDTTLARRRENGGEILSNLKSKMSKFCHECGTKFPETAKFCCECGIQRLAL